MHNPATFPLLLLALFAAGCTTNPVTGREQIFALPAVQAAHANLGFALATGAQRFGISPACQAPCGDAAQLAQFTMQVKRLVGELEAAARTLSPELFTRIDAFEISVDEKLGLETGASAGGRIALGAELARLELHDDAAAFVIAREMAHVIARHGQENSGARLFSSGLSALLPGYNLIVRFVASALGSGALVRSWAAAQRREADEIAMALLERTGRAPADVALSLARELKKDPFSRVLRARDPQADQSPLGSDWAERLTESAERVALLADLPPRYAAFGD